MPLSMRYYACLMISVVAAIGIAPNVSNVTEHHIHSVANVTVIDFFQCDTTTLGAPLCIVVSDVTQCSLFIYKIDVLYTKINKLSHIIHQSHYNLVFSL